MYEIVTVATLSFLTGIELEVIVQGGSSYLYLLFHEYFYGRSSARTIVRSGDVFVNVALESAEVDRANRANPRASFGTVRTRTGSSGVSNTLPTTNVLSTGTNQVSSQPSSR